MKKQRLLSILTLFLAISCRNPQSSFSPYLTGQPETDGSLKMLYRTLSHTETAEGRFILINRISQILRNADRITFDLFLQHILLTYPEDPFNAYYLLQRAQNCEDLKNPGAARVHYMRLLKEYPELTLEGRSLSERALEKSLALTWDADTRIELYKMKLARNPEPMQKTEIYYHLAKAYEEKKEWKKALTAYENFLGSPYVAIHNDPIAYSSAVKKVKLSKFQSVDWVYDDLNRLVGDIKYAIRTRNARLIQRYQSQAGFFASSWAQDELEAESSFQSGIGAILQRQPIRYRDTLDPISNDREAYLETWNWQYQVGKWYFYFTKIDYPADPEINGKWEWAGIYFGDKHFTTGTAEEQ